MLYYLTASGNGCSPDGTLPVGAVVCTEDQYKNSVEWTIQGNAIVAVTPSLAQQAAMAVGAGLSVSLTGAVTLTSTLFPTDLATQNKLGAVITTLMATGAFPGGATAYPMKDASGSWHTLSEIAYKAVAGAVAAYVAALDLIQDGNPLGAVALPAPSVSLVV